MGFDAAYLIRRDPKSIERIEKDGSVAVITDITVYQAEDLPPIEGDGFTVLADLVITDL